MACSQYGNKSFNGTEIAILRLGAEAIIRLTIADEHPIAQALVVIEARPAR